jgi:hypothetical protein
MSELYTLRESVKGKEFCRSSSECNAIYLHPLRKFVGSNVYFFNGLFKNSVNTQCKLPSVHNRWMNERVNERKKEYRALVEWYWQRTTEVLGKTPYLFLFIYLLTTRKKKTIYKLMWWRITTSWKGIHPVMSPQVPCKSKGQHRFNFLLFTGCSSGLGWASSLMWCLLILSWMTSRKRCWSLCGAYDLLHTGVHLLWLWEFWIGNSTWWLCRTCWPNPTVRFRSSIYVSLPLCRWLICCV